MIDCLALTLLALMIHTEAGSEPFDGKVAVAYVAVNRVEMSGKSYQAVLTQPKHFKINVRVTPSESSLLAARSALNRTLPDPTHGADHFLNPSVKPLPEWYDERYVTIIIGNHSFLKLGGF